MIKLDITLLKNNIEKAARYDFEKNKVFGSAYCVIQGGDVIYKKCFGTVSADSTQPVTENTIFRMASMTKPITAAAILILIERGLLSLDDKVSDYLPEFKDIHITQITQNGLTDLGKAQRILSALLGNVQDRMRLSLLLHFTINRRAFLCPICTARI